MLVFSCWHHFKKNVRTKYLRLKEQWETVHEVFKKLLHCDRKEGVDALVSTSTDAIDKMSDESMKIVHTEMLDEIVGTRLPFKLGSFTHWWKSQNPGEAMNSVMTKLNIGSNVPLTVVLDKLIRFAESMELQKTIGVPHDYLEMK